MSTQVINPKLLARMKDKKYRDLFVASQINKTIPYQIRALRAARNNMTQAELAERAETKQSVISRIQNKGAANLNIKSLLKLAFAFDVALIIRFEPLDGFIDWIDDLSPRVMSPEPSEKILAEIEQQAAQNETSVVEITAKPVNTTATANLKLLTFQNHAPSQVRFDFARQRFDLIKGEGTGEKSLEVGGHTGGTIASQVSTRAQVTTGVR